VCHQGRLVGSWRETGFWEVKHRPRSDRRSAQIAVRKADLFSEGVVCHYRPGTAPGGFFQNRGIVWLFVRSWMLALEQLRSPHPE